MEKNTNRQLYQMTLEKTVAIELVGRLAKFYVKERNIATVDTFVSSFFGYLKDHNIPWTDIPFYINSLESKNFPKALREKWTTQSLVGKMELPAATRAEMSVDYVLTNKQDIIQLYTDLLEMYLSNAEANIKMMSLEKVAKDLCLFDVSLDELKQVLDKQVPLYDIFSNGDVRIMEKDLVRFLAKHRTKRPTAILSNVAFGDTRSSGQRSGKQTVEATTPKKPSEPKKKKGQNNSAPKTKVEKSEPVEVDLTPTMKESENLAGDNCEVNDNLLAGGEDTVEETTPVVTEKKEVRPEEKEKAPAEESPKEEQPSPKAVINDAYNEQNGVATDNKPFDCMDMFGIAAQPSSEEEDKSLEYEMVGNNSFEDEAGTPPSSPSYRK